MKKTRLGLMILLMFDIIIAMFTGGCNTKIVTINRNNDQPVIVYNKFNLMETTKDLYVCQIGGEPQKIAVDTTAYIDIGNNGSLMGYSRRTGSYTENDVYIVERDGRQQFLDSGIMYFEIAKDNKKIFYTYSDQRDTLIVKQYLEKGEIIDIDKINCSSWSLNNDASTVCVTKEHWVDDTEEYINDLYLYDGGVLSLIAENTEYLDEDYISDNGSILFFTRYDFDVETGTLYIKREEKEPEFIAEGVHLSAQISEDGAMIVFTTNKEECQLHCLYNGCELELSDDITGYYFSRSSNTLAYISSTGGRRELYIVKEDGTPQRVADADAVAGISDGWQLCALYG